MTGEIEGLTPGIREDTSPYKSRTWWEKKIYGSVSPVERQKIIMKTWNKEIFSRNFGKLFGEEIIDTLYFNPSRYITELRDNASQWDLPKQLLHLGDVYFYNQDDNQFFIHTYKKVKDLGVTKACSVPVAHTKEFEELCDQVRSASFLIHKQEELQRLKELQLSDDEIEKEFEEDARYYAEQDVRSFGSFSSCNVLFIVTEEALNIFYSSSSNNNDGLYPIKLRKTDNPLLMQRTGAYSVYRHPIKDGLLNQDSLSPYRNPTTLYEMISQLLKEENEILYNFNEFEYLF